MENQTIASYTLGCKVNQCDTDAILARLTDLTLVNFNEYADIYLINTCTVTHTSDKKSRQMIRRAKKQNPNAFVAVCGCMTKSSPTVASELGADFVFDSREPDEFIAKVAPQHSKEANPQRNKTRTFIKIQDGCNRFCSYCIVPHVRGNPKSRPAQDILAEAKQHISNGTKEIVLTGIQVASYGEDFDNENLPSLLQKLLQLDSLSRLRLSSIEPNAITDDFLKIIASSDTLCNHFHLSLQSGSDATLQRMSRYYTTAEYENIALNLRNISPNVALTTDIIVGFPGETEQEFNESLSFVKKMAFSRIHVFEYSKRNGTPAATMPNQVPENIKSARSKQMRELAAELQLNFHHSQVGKIMPVLLEADNKGYTTNYCPVQVTTTQNLTNVLCDVEITAATPDGLLGKISGGNHGA